MSALFWNQRYSGKDDLLGILHVPFASSSSLIMLFRHELVHTKSMTSLSDHQWFITLPAAHSTLKNSLICPPRPIAIAQLFFQAFSSSYCVLIPPRQLLRTIHLWERQTHVPSQNFLSRRCSPRKSILFRQFEEICKQELSSLTSLDRGPAAIYCSWETGIGSQLGFAGPFCAWKVGFHRTTIREMHPSPHNYLQGRRRRANALAFGHCIGTRSDGGVWARDAVALACPGSIEPLSVSRSG